MPLCYCFYIIGLYYVLSTNSDEMASLDFWMEVPIELFGGLTLELLRHFWMEVTIECFISFLGSEVSIMNRQFLL